MIPEKIPAEITETLITYSNVEWTNKKLFSLFWPLIIEQLLTVTLGIADTAMVSPVGEFAVSGISLVDSINFLIITTFNSLATGGAVVASQYIGRKDGNNACTSARQLIYTNIIISTVMMILTICFSGFVLKLVYGNIADDVMKAAKTYFLITAVSYPALALYSSSSAIYRSMNNSKTPMAVAVIVNIINIGGNALFIYGFKMGVAGAALSTLIGRIIAAFILTYLLLDRSRPFHSHRQLRMHDILRLFDKTEEHTINIKGLSKIKMDWSMIKRIFKIGVPSGLETSMFQFGKILITRIFTAFGTAAIAANAVGAIVNSIAFMPGSGYGIGLLIITGQYIGAGNYDGVKKYTSKIMKLSYLTYFIINIFIFFFMNQIIGMFKLSEEAHTMCAAFLRIHLVTSTLFWCPSFVLPNALKAAGDATYVMIIASCTMWVVRVCLAYLLAFPLGFGPKAAYIAMGADFLFRGIFFATRWYNGKWMKKKVI